MPAPALKKKAADPGPANNGTSFSEEPDVYLARATDPQNSGLHTTITGYSGKQKIIKYDFPKLINLGPFLTLFAKGTVFNLTRTLFLNVGKYVVIFAISAACLLSSADVDDFADNSLPSIEQLTSNLQTFCPFLFGLFVSLTLGRWWSVRSGGIGATADHIVNVCSFLTANAARRLVRSQDWHLFKANHDRIVRYGIASLTCLAKESRGPEAPLDDLVNLKLLSESEKVLVEASPPHTRALCLWCWMTCVATETMEMVKLPPPNMNILFNDLNAGIDGLHTVHQYLGTQLPFPYVHMITLLVDLHNIVIAVAAGMSFAVKLHEENPSACIIEVLRLLIVPTMYQGLLQICVFLSDPMGDDIIDFPIMEYQLGISEACSSIIRTTRSVCEERWTSQVAPLPNASALRSLPTINPLSEDLAALPVKSGPFPAPVPEKTVQKLSDSQLQLVPSQTTSMQATWKEGTMNVEFFEQLSEWIQEVQRNVATIPPMPRIREKSQQQLEVHMTASVNQVASVNVPAPSPKFLEGPTQPAKFAPMPREPKPAAPGLLMPCCTVTPYKTLT
mmetsp:Transcript_23100/g.41741  ORF Transcript_23100/g.41741 Transcript_23100/m.41741 type:complete len:561 (+) Transcript_23100:79-1761(+)|eukprot:CAMPEP_0197643288 /NCGR_PEP_ID=MMETSP1338-20131121/16659_1 /TAXON_ID=43686 ORGANISM="Pelagodinium beii, Strain RCC1491" /NCGR_SAMPLE_ID=MMETSP1338 /ASSEMBLY_ACC=CAM_ASM_000754 /LENGTH=560 /DNA_ID=CAMNT_0043216529 /DNA_START=8 /DNA_END=1690 /DNA_ORIENTATION=+